MLYHLLFSLSDQYSWLNVFRYITFRAMVAFLLSFFFVIVLQPLFIRKMQTIGVKGQPIRTEGPKTHAIKQGTPTMGGMLIIIAVLLSTLLLADLTNYKVWLALIVMVGYATLGFIDDWSKVRHQNSKGISGRTKLFWQFGIALAVALVLYLVGFSTELTIPFIKNAGLELGLIFFLLFSSIVIVGASNAVNLTDGLDGLAIGPVMTVATTFCLIAYLCGHAKLSTYLGIPYVAGVGELTIILSSVIAGGLGFLWYNTFPAQVFMGDIGALALGGLLGLVAVLVKHEILLAIAGGIFVAEALSVIIQVYYFKRTGKRIFLMSPLHHHFELKGWAEPKIIVRFWIISIVLALISLTTLKLR
jgi:phospho-N-acetylmuramoyl-pentapeptide-transferase